MAKSTRSGWGEIRAALARHDGTGVASAAHGLKGALSYFAAGAIVDAERRLETMSREGDLGDYVVKPFAPEELQARLQVGARMIQSQKNLADRVRELEDALPQGKRLRGLLHICAYCKKIHDDKSYWQEVEAYISKHAEVQFSHGICQGCYEKFVKPELNQMKSEREAATDPLQVVTPPPTPHHTRAQA